MHGIDAMLGARVDAVSFGAAHFQLRLSNDRDEFSITTSADVCCDKDCGQDADFREARRSSGLIGLIGAELCSVVVVEPGRSALLHFDEERQVKAWWPENAYDSLFIARREGTDEWWVVE